MLPAFPEESRDGPCKVEINLFTLPLSQLGFGGFLAVFWRVKFTFLAGSLNLVLCVHRIHENLRVLIHWD